jgi:hypothetical protein
MQALEMEEMDDRIISFGSMDVMKEGPSHSKILAHSITT